MVKLVHIALLVALCVCSYLLIYGSFQSSETLDPREPHSPGATFGGTFRRGLGNNPSTLDPTLVTDSYRGAVVRQLFDGLVQFDAHLNPIPGLARFWDVSRDGRTWTFTLRQGVTFHRGREVTADDVVYSFTLLLGLNRTVTVTKVSQHIQGATAFTQGHLDETAIPAGKKDEVHTDPRYRLYQHVRIPTLSPLYIGFNTQFKPFDDRRVRQAFNYAVNKEAIVREITQSGHRLYPRATLTATGVLPPGMPGYDPKLQGYPYDPAKAKRLLAEAGYADGAGFPVVQLWSAAKSNLAKAELAAYQRYLAELGVQVDIYFSLDRPAFKAMLEQGELPMFRLIWMADIPDPDNVLSPLLHSTSPTNRTFYRNPLVDQLLELAKKVFDEARRIALYHKVERLVMDDAPWIAQHNDAL